MCDLKNVVAFQMVTHRPFHTQDDFDQNPSDERIQILQDDSKLARFLQDINQGQKINQGANVLGNIFEANYCLLNK